VGAKYLVVAVALLELEVLSKKLLTQKRILKLL
jgi:hypothetical protein